MDPCANYSILSQEWIGRENFLYMTLKNTNNKLKGVGRIFFGGGRGATEKNTES